MRKLRGAVCLALAAALLFGAAHAQMVFDGSVTGGEPVSVLAPFGGIVDSVQVRVGDRVHLGEAVAGIQTTKVYASTDGTVSGVFGREGDSTEGITERYGAVLFIEPTNKYTISASTEKAYNKSENKFIHIGEEVHLSCTADGTHRGTGIVTAVEDEGKYKVEVTGGEFYIAETVGVFRSPDYAQSSRIGRGTVAATAAVAIKGSGSILKMHVENGDFVERGELLFETVSGALDGLYSPGSDIICDVSGIVSAVDAGAGGAVEKGGKIISVYPDASTQIEIRVRESDLGSIAEGMPVTMEFNWDSNRETRFLGTVTAISHVSAQAEGENEPSYTAYVAFEPDDSVRLGMTVLVFAQGADDVEETEAEHAAADD